jgi:hypothetical protein
MEAKSFDAADYIIDSGCGNTPVLPLGTYEMQTTYSCTIFIPLQRDKVASENWRENVGTTCTTGTVRIRNEDGPTHMHRDGDTLFVITQSTDESAASLRFAGPRFIESIKRATP